MNVRNNAASSIGLDTLGDPVPSAGGTLVLSASRIRDFETCLRRYFLTHVLRVGRDETESNDDGSAALGSAVHAELHERHRDFLVRHDASDPLLDDIPLDSHGVTLVRAHSEVCPKDEATYLGGEVDLRWVILKKAVLVTGRADAIWQYSDGTVEIRDYKTGSCPTDLTDDLAASMYLLLGAANFPRAKTVRVTYESLRQQPVHLPTLVATREVLIRAHDRLLTIAEHVRRTREFPASPSPSACGTCAYRKVCPHAMSS